MSEASDKFKAAFRADRVDELRDLLTKHPELRPLVTEPWGDFDSPPVVMVRSREMLDLLLEFGADINARSHWWAGGFGLLDNAAPALAEYAISRGAVVDIHAAARLGKTGRLRELISGDPTLVHARGGDGQTPLHFAANVEIASCLLDHGAELNALDIDHESTPTQWMLGGRREVARFLVSRGARTDLLMAVALGDLELARKHLDRDPSCIRMKVCTRWFPKSNPQSGGTIYIWTLGCHKDAHAIARENGHRELSELLWERSGPEQRFAVAASQRDEATVRDLLSRAPDLPKKLEADDLEMLIGAARDNDREAVEFLLTNGWPAGTRDAAGSTALHWACFHGNAAIVTRLLREHPPLDEPDREFHSPPSGWALYGSEHSWRQGMGDYAAVLRALAAAGVALPQPEAATCGSPAARAALKRD